MRLIENQVFSQDMVRSVPTEVLRNPNNYGWFMPEPVVHLDLGDAYQDTPLNAYPALQSVYVTIRLDGILGGEYVDYPWERNDWVLQFVEQTTSDPRLARIARIAIEYLDLWAHMKVPVLGLETMARVTEIHELQMALSASAPRRHESLVLKHAKLLKLDISDQDARLRQIFADLLQWESLSLLILDLKPHCMPWSRIRNLIWLALLAQFPPVIRRVYLKLLIVDDDAGRDGDAYATLDAPITLPAVTDFLLCSVLRVTTVMEDLKLPRLKFLQLHKFSPFATQAQLLETWANCSDSLTRLEVRFDTICYDGTIIGLRKLDRLKRLAITYDSALVEYVCKKDVDAQTTTIFCELLDAISRGAPVSEYDRDMVGMLETVVTDPCMALVHTNPQIGNLPAALKDYFPLLRSVFTPEAIYDTVLNYLPALEYLAVHYDFSYLTSPALARLLAATPLDDPPQSVAALQQIRLIAFECDSADTAKFDRLPTHPAMLRALFSDAASVLYDIKKRCQFERYYPKAMDGDAVELELELGEEVQAEMMTDEFDGWVY